MKTPSLLDLRVKLLNKIQKLRNHFRLKKHTCIVCETPIHHFNPLPSYYFEMSKKHGFIYKWENLETQSISHFSCPSCFCTDRDRLFALYLSRYLPSKHGISSFTFIDFAPSLPLSRFIKKQMSRQFKNPNYRTADLFMENVDDKVDILNLSIYDNNSVDFFICSHVLEHVVDAKKALSEFYRILKTNGKAIVMVPIMLSIGENQEDPGIATPEDRWKHYMQDDHVRMYSKKGFLKDLKQAQFKVEELGVHDFPSSSFTKNGISEKSILYVVSK